QGTPAHYEYESTGEGGFHLIYVPATQSPEDYYNDRARDAAGGGRFYNGTNGGGGTRDSFDEGAGPALALVDSPQFAVEGMKWGPSTVPGTSGGTVTYSFASSNFG